MGVSLVIAPIVTACRADPWAGAPGPLGPVERTETWSVTVRGAPVAVETRAWGTTGATRWVATRTTWAWTGGRTHSASRVACDGQRCETERWDAEGTEAQLGTCAPRAWPPSADVSCTFDGAERAVTVRDGSVSWLGPAGPVELRVDSHGQPVELHEGVVTATRVDRADPPTPVDPAQLLSAPSRRFANARRSHVARFRVDGAEVRIDTPTDAELPPEADAVRGWVRHVARAIDPAFVPGRRSGAVALRLGRGDCTESALALVEVLAAAGFQARTVAGRVYVDQPEPALALHAWVEVHLGGRWVGADPAFDQFPVDATHLPLGAWVGEVAAHDPYQIELIEVR